MSEHELQERILHLEKTIRRLERARAGVQSWPGLNRLGQNTEVAGVLTVNGLVWDGWMPDADTWVYVSPTQFKIAGKDVRDRFPVGTKIKLTQTSVKYFYVVGATYSTDTIVTITGGTNYSLANAAIDSPCYSYAETPQGFPDWFSWTPVWSCTSGTQPAIGNGSISGLFTVKGKLATAYINWHAGSTTTFGSGPYKFNLPTPATGHKCSGSVFAIDSGTAYWMGVASVLGDGSGLELNHQNSGLWQYNVPFTWAANDDIRITITYRIN